DVDRARSAVCLHNHLRQAVEQAAPGLFVGLLTIRIAVSHADQAAFAGNLEVDQVVGGGNRAAFFVHHFDTQNRDIFTVGVDFDAVGSQADRCRLAGGLAPLGE